MTNNIELMCDVLNIESSFTRDPGVKLYGKVLTWCVLQALCVSPDWVYEVVNGVSSLDLMLTVASATNLLCTWLSASARLCPIDIEWRTYPLHS